MDWSGNCSEYGESDEGDEMGSDIDDLPDDELITVLRDEQNSIKEAQRLIYKEIKSIRRELKRILHHCDTTHPGQQNQQDTSDSGLGEANCTTDYNTASELASSHGDSEAGYQASVDNDNDGVVGHPGRERRNRPSSSEGMYESGPRHEGEDPFRIYKDHRVCRASSEHLVRTPNGPKPAYVISTQWNDAETNPVMNDHTQGWNSTYEDAYTMMRRRHSSMDSSKQKGTLKITGNRKQTITKQHGKRIHSIPESDQNQPTRPDNFPFREETVQSSEDELNKYSDLPQCTYDSALLTQTSKTDWKMHRKVGPHTQSADLLKVKKNICLATASPVTIDMDYPWPNTPASKTSQSPKLDLRSDSRNGLHYDRPPSVSSNDSDQNLPPHLLDSYGRLSVLSSEDESRNSRRFSDSSYDSYLETDSQRYGRAVQSSPGLTHQREYSKHRQGSKSSHKDDTASVACSEDPPRSTGDMRSRNLYHQPRNSNPNINTFQLGRDGYREKGTSPALRSNSPYQGNEMGAHVDRYTDHHQTASKYKDHKQRTKCLGGVGRSPSLPVRKVQELVSGVP